MVQGERESPRDGPGEPVILQAVAEPVETAPVVRPFEATRYAFWLGHERDRQSRRELVGAPIDRSGDGRCPMLARHWPVSAAFLIAVFPEFGRDQLDGA
jgi:hypothetical protein